MKKQWIRIAALSALVVLPCLWHKHIQATDLGSHVYNAWLAQLIHHGQAPGLFIVPQSSNVLFDLLLSSLFSIGAVFAEKAAVAIAVLVFFWGAFALCSAAADSPAWACVPLIAMAAYGFIFHMGFFNLYLSVGFSLFGMALLWRGWRWDLLLLLPIAALTWTSHLLGTGGLLALGGFLLLMRWLPVRAQVALTVAAIVAYFGVRWYVLKHFSILSRETDLYWLMGADQLAVDFKYVSIAVAVLGMFAIAFALRLVREKGKTFSGAAAWPLLYVLMATADFFAPGGIAHPKLGLMGYLPDRASLYTVILLATVIAVLRPARWQTAALTAIAVVFFAFIYVDDGALDRKEAQLAQAVATLPQGSRVLGTFFPSGSRIHEQHAIDRACVGHCFVVSNYEPGSGQFRIKASPGNRIVAWTQPMARAMEAGSYRITAEDMPITDLYACGEKMNDICIRALLPGEYVGRAAAAEMNQHH